jgi:D-serine deaminase-like pyridoxal phosphate-dependent protein
MEFKRLNSLLKSESTPLLILDEDALLENIEKVKNLSLGKKIRIATKSIRSPAIIKRILNSDEKYIGLMCYSIAEALWWLDHQVEDILVGYPDVEEGSLIKLANHAKYSNITLMVDHIEHIKVIHEVFSKKKLIVNVCIDVDLSMSFPGLYFGVKRSSIKTESDLGSFLSELKKYKSINLKGIMGYEAQIAGLPDKVQGNISFAKNNAIKVLKKISIFQLNKRRQQFVMLALESGFNIELVNGGGTGSILSTVLDEMVTEITVGSAFFSPHLFDGYADVDFRPSLYFALRVSRKPSEDYVVCTGGGYIASGSVDENKWPLIVYPKGLSFDDYEGCGEVQTPLKVSRRNKIKIGDLVFFRHSKAGEICERFNEIVMIKKNGKEIERISTYRGEAVPCL